jgi:ligand-binding sensor domain-containing protein
MGIAMDRKGTLWMGTYSGLSRFDTATKQLHNFTALMAYPDEQFPGNL